MTYLQCAIAAVAWLMLPACASAKPADALAGRVFLLESSAGAELLEGAGVSLRFHKDGLSLQADCNTLSATYKISDGRLVVGDLMETAMGCDPERHARDAFLGKLIGSKPKLLVEGSQLMLQGEGVRLVFRDREVADPDRTLTEPAWLIGTYVDGNTAMGLMGIKPPRLTFEADGTWQAHATCLEASGAYAVEGDRIAISKARASIASDCKDDNDREAATYTASVMKDGVLTLRIDGRGLSLLGKPRGLGADAVPR